MPRIGAANVLNDNNSITFTNASGVLEGTSLAFDSSTKFITQTETDTDIAIQPNGSGAFRASVSGDTRGTNAVDLQMARDTTDQVASGFCSVIAGGQANKVTSFHSFVVGNTNYIAGNYSAVMGKQNSTYSVGNTVAGQGNVINLNSNFSTAFGYNNTISDSAYATAFGNSHVIDTANNSIAGGNNHTITNHISCALFGENNSSGGNNCFIGGLGNSAGVSGFAAGEGNVGGDFSACVGKNNNASNYAFCGGAGYADNTNDSENFANGVASFVFGRANISDGNYTFVLGRNNNTISNANYSFSIGRNASARFINTFAHGFYFDQAASGPYDSGDLQFTTHTLYQETTSATLTQATLDGDSTASTSNQITLEANKSYFIKATFCGRTSEEFNGMFIRHCWITENYLSTVNTIGTDINSTSGNGPWTAPTITLEDTDNIVEFNVASNGTDAVKFIVYVEIIEIRNSTGVGS